MFLRVGSTGAVGDLNGRGGDVVRTGQFELTVTVKVQVAVAPLQSVAVIVIVWISNGQTRSDGRVLGDGNRAEARGSICQNQVKSAKVYGPGRRLIGRQVMVGVGWAACNSCTLMSATPLLYGLGYQKGRSSGRPCLCSLTDDW